MGKINKSEGGYVPTTDIPDLNDKVPIFRKSQIASDKARYDFDED